MGCQTFTNYLGIYSNSIHSTLKKHHIHKWQKFVPKNKDDITFCYSIELPKNSDYKFQVPIPSLNRNSRDSELKSTKNEQLSKLTGTHTTIIFNVIYYM